jgi:hypothetical protein
MWGTQNGHGLQKLATLSPGKVPSTWFPHSCIQILWYTGHFCLFKSRDFQKCISDLQISFAVTTKMNLFSVVWKGPKKTCKLWPELFVTDRVITTSAIDDMHSTQVIVYSTFIKIYGTGNTYGLMYPEFFEHGDFLVKRFLHNFKHRA